MYTPALDENRVSWKLYPTSGYEVKCSFLFLGSCSWSQSAVSFGFNCSFPKKGNCNLASTAVSLKKETALYLKKDKLVPDRCIHSVLRLKNLSVRLSCAVSRSRCRILTAVSKCSRKASLVQRCCEPKFCTQRAARRTNRHSWLRMISL